MVKKNDLDIATIEEIVQNQSEVEEVPFQLKSGKWVVVKPLNRKQALRFRRVKMARDVFEQKLVSMALVDPKMTAAQVSAWQEIDKADGDLRGITDLIVEISGMKEMTEGAKNGTKSND